MEEEEDLDNSQNGESKGVISESDLLDIYDTHYYDLFPKILKIDEDKFFSLLQEQVLLTLRIINKLSDLSLMSFFQDLISERYKADKKKVTIDMTKIKTLPENEIAYLDYSNCYIHCHKNLDCFHKCSNKLILYQGFIYCLNCKKAYNENQIKLYCKECNKSYYSKLRENVEEKNKFLIPVVFSRPHCEPDNNENEIIKCLECAEDLYYDLSKVKDQKNKLKKLSDTIKDLVCPNCKLIYDTKEIGFNCPECDEEFTSDALLYNEFSIHKKRILFLVHTLMKAIAALPDNYNEKKCKCDINTFKEFSHIDDNGLLLKGYKDEYKIVCKECFEVFEKNNYEWKCPSCGEVFKSEKIENKDINDNDIKNEDNQNEIQNDVENNEDNVENNEEEENEENDNENIIRDNSEDEKNNEINNGNEIEIEKNNEDGNLNNNDIENENENENDFKDNSQNEDENGNGNENNDEIEAEDGNENNNEVEAKEGNENGDIQNEEFEEEKEINKEKELKDEGFKKEEIKKDIIKKEDNKKEIIKKEIIRKEVIKKEDNKKEDNKNERKIIIINNFKDNKEIDYKNYNKYKNNSSNNNNKVYANYNRKENKVEEKKENNYKYKVDLTKYKMNNNYNTISKNQNSLINNKENIDKNKYNSNINKYGNQSNNIKRSDQKVNHNYINIQNINKNNYNNEPKYDYKKQYNKEIIKNYKDDKKKEPQKNYKNVSSKYIYDSKKNNNNNISSNFINRNNNDIQKRTEYINNNNNLKSNNINSRQNHQIININESNRNNDKRKKYIINEEPKKEVNIIKSKDIKDKENINKENENKVKEKEKEKEKENKDNKNRQNKSKENIIKGSKSRENKSRENKSKENKSKIIKFKNIQKYFEDFNEEYEKENEYKNKLKEKIKNKHKNLRDSEKEDKNPLKYNINNVHIISNVSNNDANNLKKENKMYNYTDSNNYSNKNHAPIIAQFNSKKENIIIKNDNEGNLPENKMVNSNKNLPKKQSYIKSNNYQNENKNNVPNEPKKQDIDMNGKSHKNDLNQKLIYIKNDKNKKKENENEDKQTNIIKQELENKDESNNDEKNKINSNNYKNLKILGHGSYGKIYLVEDIKTKAKYAMKKLIIGDSLELKDNQDEYNMIMKITELYPELNIIHVFGTETKKFDDYNYVFYVLMEVANCDWEKELMNRAKNKAYYTEEELFFILECLVDTFSYLQQIGICHRDIKPQNILCFGEKGYKISDFGEAKYRKKWRLQQSEIEYTAMQTIRGTELYMSPILYVALKTAPNKGANHNVFKSDVFSLGMCFLFASCLDYKCLYSVRRATDMNKLRAVIEQYVNKRYSQSFIEILLWMLHLNEKERPDFIELSAMI